MRMWMMIVVTVAFGGCAEVEEDPRGTVTTDLDIKNLRVEVRRVDGSIEEIADEEVFLSPGNLGMVYLTVVNHSDGWWKYSFQLCTDHVRAVVPVYFGYESLDTAEYVIPDPEGCVFSARDGEWHRIERDEERERFVGGFLTRDRPASGELEATLSVEMPDAALVSIIDYEVPYTVLPSNDDDE